MACDFIRRGTGLGRGALGIAAVVAIWICGPAAARPAHAASESAGGAIVSLGDSFISGEGGRWMGNAGDPSGTRSGTDRAAYACRGSGRCRRDPHLIYGESEDNGCHRSDVAPILSAPIPAVRAVNLACSGARARNLWPAAAGGRSLRGELPQVDQLEKLARSADVRLVVVTVGANDVGFGRMAIGCALAWARSAPSNPRLCQRRAQEQIEARLPAMQRDMLLVLRAARATMAEAGHGPRDYRLVTMGYSSPFPGAGGIRYPEGGWSRLTKGGCPLWDADAGWAGDWAVPSIVEAMRVASAKAEAEFLDVRHAFDGHRLCDGDSRLAGPAGPSPSWAEWVRRLDFLQGSLRESLHPNAYGQRALGACIGLLYGRPRGDYACRALPGLSYARGMRVSQLTRRSVEAGRP